MAPTVFKSDFKLEQYISHSQNIKHTQAQLRFRISYHNSHIETGLCTHPKMPVDRSIYCNADAIEDEIHFLVNCVLYNVHPRKVITIE